MADQFERPIGTVPPAAEEEPEGEEEFEEPEFGEPFGAPEEKEEERGGGGPELRLPKKKKPGAKPTGPSAGKAAAGKAGTQAAGKAAAGAAAKTAAAAGVEAATGPAGWVLLAAQLTPYVAKYGKWIIFASAFVILLAVVTILIFLGVLACYIPGTCGGLTSTQAVNITQDKTDVTTLLASVGDDLAKNTLSADEAKNVQSNIQKLKELLKDNPEALKKVEELEKEVNILLNMLTANKDGKVTDGIKKQRERVRKIINELRDIISIKGIAVAGTGGKDEGKCLNAKEFPKEIEVDGQNIRKHRLADAEIVDKLTELYKRLPPGFFVVTDACEAQGRHDSPQHFNGKAIDIAIDFLKKDSRGVVMFPVTNENINKIHSEVISVFGTGKYYIKNEYYEKARLTTGGHIHICKQPGC